MTHAEQRVRERLTDAGMATSKQDTLFRAICYLATKCDRDTAIRVLTLPRQVNDPWSDRSNGNQLWAIVRNGQVATVMLRRDTQPADCQALRVDAVQFL